VRLDAGALGLIGGSIAASDGSRIATAILSMGRGLNVRVAAVGVETDAVLAFLKANHFDETQGYYFSPPLPPEVFARLIETGFIETVPIER
jgi:EAL domain-containing protein (putative c-di-GMP-specific phosphodiesterase class I)